jgi:hypothetical protein
MLRRYVAGFGLSFVVVALSPRVGFRLFYWPGRLGPRGVLAWVVGDTALKFAVLAYLPKARRISAAYEDELAQLGHEPDDQEMLEIYHRVHERSRSREGS